MSLLSIVLLGPVGLAAPIAMVLVLFALALRPARHPSVVPGGFSPRLLRDAGDGRMSWRVVEPDDADPRRRAA